MHASAIAALLLVGAGARLLAQGPAPGVPAITIGGVTVSGSLRTRLESWDWFGDTANGSYTYPGSLVRIGLGQVHKKRDWPVEITSVSFERVSFFTARPPVDRPI